jgi:hypothetical protein
MLSVVSKQPQKHTKGQKETLGGTRHSIILNVVMTSQVFVYVQTH